MLLSESDIEGVVKTRSELTLEFVVSVVVAESKSAILNAYVPGLVSEFVLKTQVARYEGSA